MPVIDAFFYFFASATLLGSLMVSASTRPLHSAIWLIMVICNAAALMILAGVEFMAMLYIIVYVGAIMVLFLFIIMMIGAGWDTKKHSKITLSHFLVPTIGLGALAQLSLIVVLSKTPDNLLAATPVQVDIKQIAKIMYSEFILEFQICGLILFAAMVASIILAKYRSNYSKRLPLREILARSKENSVQLVKSGFASKLQKLKYND